MTPVKVGLIGLGAIGRLHFACWRKSPHAHLSAIASRDARKRAGDWPAGEFNLGDATAEKVDLTGVRAYATAEELLADPDIDVVDICTATPLHAPLTIAALRAGKHVVCEKPMALTEPECAAVEEAARTSGRQLMVAHCLRFWPQYERAFAAVRSGEFGRPRYARLERAGGIPAWSAEGWLMKPESSGGVFDLHIHDIDVALWWFGEPVQIAATGCARAGLPLIVDATWQYAHGLTVQLHGAWDPNGGAFRHAFRLVCERATLVYDLALNPRTLQCWQDGVVREMPMEEPQAHQAELDCFAEAVASGRPFTRFTPSESHRAVAHALEEWRQLGPGS